MKKFNKLKRRSEYLKRDKRSISERLTTEIIDYKTKISSIKRRTSMIPASSGTPNDTKYVRSKRKSY